MKYIVCMMENVYKKLNFKKTDIYMSYSVSSRDKYYSKRSNLIKNYILVPDYKIVKEKFVLLEDGQHD